MSTIKDTALAHREKALSLLEEFRAFAFKGNVIDLAVGVIIGAAFGGVIGSLVKHILMPLIGVLLPGEQSYLKWKWVIGGQEILYGQFLGEVLNFLIVALALFLVIRKFMGWVMRVRKEEAGKVPAMTKDQELLTEIRDLLKGSRPPEGGTARGEIQV
jgi:large conductance mechanosensitive channel